MKKENSDRLAAQKEKFEGKLKDIASLANKQYKENLEKGLSQLNKNIESRDKTIGRIENENKAIKNFFQNCTRCQYLIYISYQILHSSMH